MKNEQDIIDGSKEGLETKFETKYHTFFSYVLCFVPLLLRFKKHL
jgi:phospholipid N-methyltransferase